MKETVTKNSWDVGARFVQVKDLDDMEVTCIPGAVCIETFTPSKKPNAVRPEISNRMPVAYVPDCQQSEFRADMLERVLAHQESAGSDFHWLPAFKSETRHDTMVRLDVARSIRSRSDKVIVFEVGYKTDLAVERLLETQESFDVVAIKYGSHHIGEPAFESIAMLLKELRVLSDVQVWSVAVPHMFMGAHNQESYLMPIWSLISDAWVKAWRQAGGKSKFVKAIDPQDRRNKKLEDWLASGWVSNDRLASGHTVYELLQSGRTGDKVRELHRAMLLDEIFQELRVLEPASVERYVASKCASRYYRSLVDLYNEMLIQELLIRHVAFTTLTTTDRFRLARKARETFSPPLLSDKLNGLIRLMSIKGTTIGDLIASLE